MRIRIKLRIKMRATMARIRAHRARFAALLAVLAVLGVVGLLVLASPARAQTLDPGRCASSAEGESGLGGGGNVGGGAGGGGGGSWGGEPTSSTTSTTVKGDDGEGGVCSALLDGIAPGPDPGTHPTSHYDIGYDQGGTCVCASRRLTGWWTAFFFTAAGWITRIGLGIINWVLNFQFARLLMEPAQRIADAYQNDVVGRVGAAPFFLFITAFWALVLTATGRLGRGLAELGTSLVILAFAAAFWTNPAASLTRGLEFTAGVSSEIAAVTTGAQVDAPTPSNAVGASMARSIHQTFVENTHQIINWGRLIPEGDQCRAVYDAAVASGPWGTSSKPRVAMKEAGCRVEDKFNRDPSFDRLASAFLVMIGSLLLMAMLVLVAYELLKAQLGIVVAVVTWSFALPTGALPGWGRGFFWGWIANTVTHLINVLAMMMMLALTLVAVSAVLETTESERLVPQMLSVIVVVAIGLFKRKKFMESGQRAASRFASRMSGGRASASSSGWLAGSLAGIGTGAIVAKTQHAFQTHGTNQRSRDLVALTKARNAHATEHVDRQTMAGEASAAHLDSLLSLFSNAAAEQAARRQTDAPRARPQGGPREPVGLPTPGPIQAESRETVSV